MTNQLNSGALDTLKAGETLLVSARKVSGDKLHLEFAEVINNGKAQNILGMLNKSDERFSSSARRAWVTAEPADATEYFGCDFGPTAGWEMTDKGEYLYMNILNPTIGGTRCRIQILETTEANEWQAENYKTAAKRKGKDGDFITHEGNYIYSNTQVIMSDDDPTHTILQPDATTIAAEDKVNMTTGEVLGDDFI
tara:strand:+ start:707 stop:1291 length:585 start_codon:yes stop_codon:yes gene_type:complete